MKDWFNGFFARTPFWTLAGAATMAAAVVLVALWAATDTPWLGITVGPNLEDEGAKKPGLRITAVARGGPAAGVLRTDQRIVALAAPGGEWFRLIDTDILSEPDTLAHFPEYNQFQDRQRAISRILSGPGIRLRLDSGAVVQLQPQPSRPWYDLPPGFWLLVGFGVVAFMVAVAVWASSRKGQTRLPARLLGACGAGFMISAVVSAVYIERELALDTGMFGALETANQAGILLFAIAGSALLSCYPRRLAPRLRLHWVMLTLGALVWLNLFFQWTELPWHNIYIPLFVAYTLAVGFSLFQWRRTHRDPLARTALKWMMLSIFLTTGAALLAFFVPAVFGTQPLVSATVTGAMGFLMFVGLAAGVARYRLFDLERWWLDIWLWFLAGAAIFGLDVLLIYTLHLLPVAAFGLAVVTIAWLYTPLRGWLWRTLSSDPTRLWEEHLPEMLEAVSSAANRAELLQCWQRIVSQVFRPADIGVAQSGEERTRVLDNGARLQLSPLHAGGPASVLSHKQRGTRLFTRDDARLAGALVALARRSFLAFEARELAIAQERKRIMRDLHDDVGARLLTLSRSCRDPYNAGLARHALATLRDTVRSLNPRIQRNLAEATADWRGEMAQRLEDASVEFEWSMTESLPDVMLGNRQRVHLHRILQEGVNNLLRHAEVKHVHASIRIAAGALHLTLVNDGVKTRFIVPGQGLENMAERASELGGRLQYSLAGEGETLSFRLEIEVPLYREADRHAARTGG